MSDISSQELQRILDGISVALEVTKAGDPSIYDLNTNEIVAIADVAEVCAKNPDCTLDTTNLLVGDRKYIKRLVPQLNLQRLLGQGIGSFAILNSQALGEILLRLNPEDVINLCNSNMKFRERCELSKIYERLLNKFFPTDQSVDRINNYESKASLFERLWRTRVLIIIIQALDMEDFELHPGDADAIFNRYVNAVNNVVWVILN